MPDDLPPRVIAGIAFVGRTGGAVKALGGFRKGHHTLPDVANAVTTAFLGRICEPDLAAEAERLFQDARTGLDYKRKDIGLSVTSPTAVLTARDFTLELAYSLEASDPTHYTVTTTLQELSRPALAKEEAFSRIFAGRFTEISFTLEKGVRVEAVIDAIESLDLSHGLSVTYPSDYHDCTLRVEGVDAMVRCTGSSLEVVFPRGAAPGELIAAFATVRNAFQISKVLRGLIG